MNIILFFWLIFSTVITLSVTNGQETFMDEMTNMRKAIEDLKTQIEEKIDSTYNELKNDSQVLQQQLTSLKLDTETNLTKILESKEKKTDCYTFDSTTGYGYKLLKDLRYNWYHAKLKCESEGGELASIRTTQEWQFVKEVINLGGADAYVWLGGTDVLQERNWLWTDGSPVSFTDWRPDFPRNMTRYNCLAGHIDFNWGWFDSDCYAYARNYAVCKIQA